MPRINSAVELEELRQSILQSEIREKPCIAVCAEAAVWVSVPTGSPAPSKRKSRNWGCSDKVDVKATGCHGFCEKVPTSLSALKRSAIFEVKPEDAPDIVSDTVKERFSSVWFTPHRKPVRRQYIRRGTVLPIPDAAVLSVTTRKLIRRGSKTI